MKWAGAGWQAKDSVHVMSDFVKEIILNWDVIPSPVRFHLAGQLWLNMTEAISLWDACTSKDSWAVGEQVKKTRYVPLLMQQ